jgi:putative transposase
VLRILKLNRSTYYYCISKPNIVKKENGGRPVPGYSFSKNATKISDEEIEEFICEIIAGDGQYYGYRKITVVLRREYNLVINKKKVYRLCKEMGMLRPQRKIKPKHPRKLSRNREIVKSNTLWEADLKYGYIIGEDKFFYVMSIIDVYDRNIVDYHIGLQCEGKDAAVTLQRALLRRELFAETEKPVIRTDNGPQFISNVFGDKCEELKVEHERIPVKTPNKNAHIESFHRIFEDECLGVEEFETYGEAYQAVVDFMERYNKRRIHSSIDDLAPAAFYRACLNGTAKQLTVKV